MGARSGRRDVQAPLVDSIRNDVGDCWQGDSPDEERLGFAWVHRMDGVMANAVRDCSQFAETAFVVLQFLGKNHREDLTLHKANGIARPQAQVSGLHVVEAQELRLSHAVRFTYGLRERLWQRIDSSKETHLHRH